ncbi:MAG: type II toxin-antitoxin system RelE/ParE family toxin [Beijerinckiaceae bacterium]|nr:type II toxin-antitoxin system RelE/ParE family toxin [Beijerinckiaceae bacterium]
MSENRLTGDTDDDLLKLLLYGIETFGLPQAEAYRKGMTQCFQLLADNPRLGRKADEFAPARGGMSMRGTLCSTMSSRMVC